MQLRCKHGLSKTRFLRIYYGVTARCTNKKHHDYLYYGGRGIKNLWKSADSFLEDMYESYVFHVNKFGEKNTTLDRINTDGDYCKQNCKWKTRKEQSRNTQHNTLIPFQGKTLCIAEWEEETGLSQYTISMRLQRGWSIKRTLTTAVTK